MKIRFLSILLTLILSQNGFSQALTPQGELKLPKLHNNFGAGISFEVPILPSSFLYYPSRITDSTSLYKNAYFSEGFIPQAELYLFHSRNTFLSVNFSYSKNKTTPGYLKTGFSQYETGLQFTHTTHWSLPGFIYPLIGLKVDYRHNLLEEYTVQFFPNPTYDHSYRNLLEDESNLVDVSIPAGFMLANGNFRFILSSTFEIAGLLNGEQSIIRDTYLYETFISSAEFNETYSHYIAPFQLASFNLTLVYIFRKN